MKEVMIVFSDDNEIPIKISRDDVTVNYKENETLGEALFPAKESSGISLAELSRQTGISESSITRHITNQSLPNLEMLIAYCIVLRANMFQTLYYAYKAGYNLFYSDEKKTYLLIIMISHHFGLTIQQANDILKSLGMKPIKWYDSKRESLRKNERNKSI